MLKSKSLTLLLVSLCIPIMISCKKGCRDEKSLSFDEEAKRDNNSSCRYSTASFYMRFGAYNDPNSGIIFPIIGADISVNGEYIGTASVTYPNGPGNCLAPGTCKYEFKNSSDISWNAIIKTPGGNLFTGGTIGPSRFNECLAVNVTR